MSIKSLLSLCYLTSQRLQGRTWPWRQETRQITISFFWIKVCRTKLIDNWWSLVGCLGGFIVADSDHSSTSSFWLIHRCQLGHWLIILTMNRRLRNAFLSKVIDFDIWKIWWTITSGLNLNFWLNHLKSFNRLFQFLQIWDLRQFKSLFQEMSLKLQRERRWNYLNLNFFKEISYPSTRQGVTRPVVSITLVTAVLAN